MKSDKKRAEERERSLRMTGNGSVVVVDAGRYVRNSPELTKLVRRLGNKCKVNAKAK